VAQGMFTISNASRQRYLKMLIYGDFGVGKTTLVTGAQDIAEMADVLIIDAESGTMVIDNRDDIDVVTISTYQQFARVYDYLRIHCKYRDEGDLEKLAAMEIKLKGLDPEKAQSPEEETDILGAIEAIRAKPKRYRTVIIDSLTEVQKYAMYQLLGVDISGNIVLDVPPDNPQFKEWGQSAEMIRLLVRCFRNLPMHSLFVCSRTEDQDDRKRMFYVPAMPGKLSNEIQGFMDVVGFYTMSLGTDNQTQIRRLYLTPSQQWKAKHRFKNFTGAYIDNPSMLDLLKLHSGKWTSTNT
jgi:hypothetical protein